MLLKEFLTALANKFRDVLDITDPINAQDFPDKVTEVYETGKQAEYDKFWDNFQDNGNRTNYDRGFIGYGWNPENFYPKYDIKPTSDCTRMFYAWNKASHNSFDFKKRLEDCGVVLDTSGATNLHSAFSYSRCSALPTIDLTGVTQYTNFLFSNCYAYLKTIEKIIVAETTPISTDWFVSTSGLTNVTFEGTIANNIDFSSCTLLTHESLMSIINHLKDFSGTGTTRTLTIGTTNQAKLTDAEKSIATQKGWTLA